MIISIIVIDYCYSDDNKKCVVGIERQTNLFVKVEYGDDQFFEELSRGIELQMDVEMIGSMYPIYKMNSLISKSSSGSSIHELLELKAAYPIMALRDSTTGRVIKVKEACDLLEITVGVQLKARMCGCGDTVYKVIFKSREWIDFWKDNKVYFDDRRDKVLDRINSSEVYCVVDFNRTVFGGCINCMGMVILDE